MANKVFYAHDPVEYAAHSLSKGAQVSLARVVVDEGALVARNIARHMWSQGLVTFEKFNWRTMRWTFEVKAQPTFLGQRVYRFLKSQGVYDLRT